MLIYSMNVSVDGYIADRNGDFAWTQPTDELFAFHLERVRELGRYLCGRRLYETMLGWDTDPALRQTELGAEFAEVWTALPKVVFSRSLRHVEGNARLAASSLAEEIARAGREDPAPTAIGGAELAAAAIDQRLVDELRIFRLPVVVGGGSPFLRGGGRRFFLSLSETTTFASGVTYARYQVDQ